MAIKHIIKKAMILIVISIALVQCQSTESGTVTSASEMAYIPTKIYPVTPTVVSPQTITTGPDANLDGCTLPPIQISSLNIRRFYWSEDSKSIIFKEKNGQVWYSYNIISGQTNTATTAISVTVTPEYEKFNLGNYQAAFISPSGTLIVFTRGSHEDSEIYYKTLGDNAEHYLGTIHGVIEKVDWFNDEKNAIIALDWAGLPTGLSAYVYLASFSENALTVEISKSGPYGNVHYLGLTPDNTRFMFVTYQGNPTLNFWNIATDEVSETPMFNPVSFHWVSENEIISVNPNRDKLYFVNVLLYNIDTLETTYLADGKFELDPFIQNGLISPDGASVAYIENKTDNLYWTKCIH